MRENFQPLSSIVSARDVLLEGFRSPESYAHSFRQARARISNEFSALFRKLPFGEELRVLLQAQEQFWRAEQPPLEWYATAVVAYLFCESLPTGVLLQLVRAANYFGNSHLALEILDELERQSPSEIRFEIIKQRARAFKDDGAFPKARECYRKLLQAQSQDNRLVAYLLVLYAKLCAHYQQRTAWHQALHEIAFKRLYSIRKEHKRDEQVTRWRRISVDSFAKIVFPKDRRKGEDLFKEALKLCQKRDGSYVRVSAHLHEQRILWLSSAPEPAGPAELEQELWAFYDMVELSKTLGNDRASSVRRLQYLSLARHIAERLRRDGLPLPVLIETLLDGGAVAAASDTEQQALKLSDLRTAGLSAFERARWRALDGNDEPALSMADLETARARFTAPSSPYFGPYFKVVRELGKSCKESGDWPRTTSLYEEAYEYAKELALEVEKEERELERSLGNGPSGGLPEIGVLTAQERKNLLKELRQDYRELLDRVLTLSDELHFAHREHLSKSMRERLQQEQDFRYHSLARRLRELSGLVLAGSQPEQVIKQLSNDINTWFEEGRRRQPLHRIELVREVEKVVNEARLRNPSWSGLDITVSGDPPLHIMFSEWILLVILENVVTNIQEAARRAQLSLFQIRLTLSSRNGIAFLGVRDNVGDLERFRAVIQDINKDQRPQSQRDSTGGRGLLSIRTFLRIHTEITEPWEVLEVLGEPGDKELMIPLTRVGGML